MKSSSVLIVGCGDLGNRTAALLQREGWQVTGVRRSLDKLGPGIEGVSADYTQPGSLDFARDLKPDFVLATFNPFDRSEAGYIKGFRDAMQNLLDGLGTHAPRYMVMSSSTRVFAERDGGWVNEDSALSQEDPWAQAIIAAEQLLQQAGHLSTVVRFAGIYGIPGGRLLSRVRRGELCPAEPVSFTNRIHREDCAGFLAHLFLTVAQGGEARPVYIGADGVPAPRYEVESWLAQQMGLSFDNTTADGGAAGPTQHNRAGHRRCRNDALLASGYRLRYPSFREGYGVLLSSPG